jgi:hypothetical protein
MSGSQYDDLADRVAEAVRAYVLKRMPPDPTGELATGDFRGLLHSYANGAADTRRRGRGRCTGRGR